MGNSNNNNKNKQTDKKKTAENQIEEGFTCLFSAYHNISCVDLN